MLWGTLPDTTWLWVCEPQADGTTRLITRIRSHYRWLSPSIAFSLLVEFADIWMIRKMLLNLGERAEALARGESADSAPRQNEGRRSVSSRDGTQQPVDVVDAGPRSAGVRPARLRP